MAMTKSNLSQQRKTFHTPLVKDKSNNIFIFTLEETFCIVNEWKIIYLLIYRFIKTKVYVMFTLFGPYHCF